MEKQTLAFREISHRLKALDLPHYDMIVGISRGGIVPAAMIAHQLDTPLQIVSVNYRDDNNSPRYDSPQGLADFEVLRSMRGKVLVVDDVSVSGKTLQFVLSLLEECDVATLVCKGSADYVLFPEVDRCVHWPWTAKEAKSVKEPTS